MRKPQQPSTESARSERHSPSLARVPRVLSIAGSDSGGGAGIQADLKAFAACGVHGMTAITAITAQNTVGVTGVHTVPPETILAQVRAVSSDIGVDAVKIGMLGNAETVAAVAAALDELPTGTPVVLDPVMVAESGAQLLDSAARAALTQLLLPRATMITPNVPEARALVAEADASGTAAAHAATATTNTQGRRVPQTGEEDLAALARRLHALGPKVVIITGGHRRAAIDVFYDGHTLLEIPGERHPDGAAHGSGCTHSSALAAALAWGEEPLDAARSAKAIASGAVAAGLSEIGAGAGPVDAIGLPGRALTRQ
ncbi:MAG: hydroxymethylpyrimidine/phosphomethylpyrimidine kinase [Solirubrobacterales bacterium]|nr:hydroxymethylpyrimidine/phosphomethylpyrimidine kinase [Solirubrobacterales bacterium]